MKDNSIFERVMAGAVFVRRPARTIGRFSTRLDPADNLNETPFDPKGAENGVVLPLTARLPNRAEEIRGRHFLWVPPALARKWLAVRTNPLGEREMGWIGQAINLLAAAALQEPWRDSSGRVHHPTDREIVPAVEQGLDLLRDRLTNGPVSPLQELAQVPRHKGARTVLASCSQVPDGTVWLHPALARRLGLPVPPDAAGDRFWGRFPVQALIGFQTRAGLKGDEDGDLIFLCPVSPNRVVVTRYPITPTGSPTEVGGAQLLRAECPTWDQARNIWGSLSLTGKIAESGEEMAVWEAHPTNGLIAAHSLGGIKALMGACDTQTSQLITPTWLEPLQGWFGLGPEQLFELHQAGVRTVKELGVEKKQIHPDEWAEMQARVCKTVGPEAAAEWANRVTNGQPTRPPSMQELAVEALRLKARPLPGQFQLAWQQVKALQAAITGLHEFGPTEGKGLVVFLVRHWVWPDQVIWQGSALLNLGHASTRLRAQSRNPVNGQDPSLSQWPMLEPLLAKLGPEGLARQLEQELLFGGQPEDYDYTEQEDRNGIQI